MKPDSRGTLYSVFGLSGSLGILLINEVGGILFKKDHHWPFLITIGAFLIFAVITVIFGVAGKVKV